MLLEVSGDDGVEHDRKVVWIYTVFSQVLKSQRLVSGKVVFVAVYIVVTVYSIDVEVDNDGVFL